MAALIRGKNRDVISKTILNQIPENTKLNTTYKSKKHS